MKKVDLKGKWKFCLDPEKEGIEQQYYKKTLNDTIELPATVSTAKKGIPSDEINIGYLTDPYEFTGYTWYSRNVKFELQEGKEVFLILERTRISHVWVDETYVGNNNSLCTPHRYRLTQHIRKQSRITIMVDNAGYPVKGGHMTSPDTQTNWNGITGEIYLEECSKVCLTGIKIYPDAEKRFVKVKTFLNGADKETVTAYVSDDNKSFPKAEYEVVGGSNSFTYYMDETAETWSEHTPKLYQLNLELKQRGESEKYSISFGLRNFMAVGSYFEINGIRTFLRGKHDGMIFPLTGYAPADLTSWMRVLGIAKQYGINHYRFHTCCPPDAAFTAADMLGIYMEPELPFWGTVTEEGEENHDDKAQQYLIKEGFRILDEFGNHPSFVMMSLGNELWGSQSRLNQILGGYREYDTRHLYTQGSNNFQFMPCILENDDFFCGVRFSGERLFRGSYAMCDAPQGHIQTMPPDMIYNYDEIIRPSSVSEDILNGGDVTIQYGTGTKKVKMDASSELIPEVPVVSHEIGQYAMFPDFTEIEKYTGVLKARNFEEFQRRFTKAGLFSMAEKFFQASGNLAADCYKAELETALRSNELAGFQLLDLQDFTGQGTALVGILNSFMENKGLISQKRWQQFCWDKVLLLELPKLVFSSGESLSLGVKLAVFHPEPICSPEVELSISNEKETLVSEKVIAPGEYFCGVFQIAEFKIRLPEIRHPQRLTVDIKISEQGIQNTYHIWVYPEYRLEKCYENIKVTGKIQEAIAYLKEGKKVLFYPENLQDSNSIMGTYCTDFWCYPMFRSISESMNKPVPVGTHGLLIDNMHPVFRYFPTEYYTTAQWYDIISNSRALILDNSNIRPIVWSIDNFERNHKLGNLFELRVGEGKLFVCTSDLRKLTESYPAKWLEYSILQYMASQEFEPELESQMDELILWA